MTPRTWGSDLINITKNIYFEKNEIYGKKLHVLCEGSMCCWIVFQFGVWLIYRYYLRSLMGRIGLATSTTHTYKLTKVVSNTHSFLLLFGVENTFYMTHILQVIQNSIDIYISITIVKVFSFVLHVNIFKKDLFSQFVYFVEMYVSVKSLIHLILLQVRHLLYRNSWMKCFCGHRNSGR